MGVDTLIAHETGVPPRSVQEAQAQQQQALQQARTSMPQPVQPMVSLEKTDLLFWLQVAEVVLLALLVVKL